jgi:hypothetical protein
VPNPLTDNTLAKARNLGVMSGTRTIKDSIGLKDKEDYSQFSLSSSSNVSLRASGIQSGATIKLNLKNALGQVLQQVNLTKKQPTSLNWNLAAGTYYLDVARGKGNTRYTFQLKATPSTQSVPVGPSVPSSTAALSSSTFAADPGSSIDSATDIGTLTSSRTVNDSLGGYRDAQQSSIDAADVYRFTLLQPGHLNAVLKGLEGAASGLYLIDDDGAQVALNTSSKEPTIDVDLNRGTYYLKATGVNAVKTNYSLSLTPTIFQTTTMGDPGDIASTSYQMGSLTGTKTYQDFVTSAFDNTDMYRFTVPGTSNVTVSVNDTGAPVNLSLAVDTNNDGNIDSVLNTRSMVSQSSITATLLSTATYYVTVERYPSSSGPTAGFYSLAFSS